MTVLAVITLTCDGCGATYQTTATSRLTVRAEAREHGWHEHHPKTKGRVDLCPQCPPITQERPTCDTCGKWKRTDHACPGPPAATPRPASTRRLPKLRHV